MERYPNRQTFFSSALIILLCVLAWSNSFTGPFVLDDKRAIAANPAVHSLWPPWSALTTSVQTGEALSCRPLTQFTLAVNYFFSGTDVKSYHAVNLGIHILSALALFGIIRQTLAWGRLKAIRKKDAVPLALIISLAWALNPLQTESVTYIIQRTESLAGLCVLLTLYFSVRGWRAGNPRVFHLLGLLSFSVGIGAKETIALAPVLVFLYDWMFVSKNVRAAFSGSRLLYGGLVVCMLPLGMVLLAGGIGSARTGEIAYSPFSYFLTQTQVVWQYIRLSLWPTPLVFDYGPWPVPGIQAAIFPGLVLGILFAASFWAVLKKRPAGYPGAWFFLLLGPTSSFMPLNDPYFEHRLYLALAAPVVLVVMGIYVLVCRIKNPESKRISQSAALVLAAVAIFALGAGTYSRNRVYKSGISLWSDTVQKRPANARALHNLGGELLLSGQGSEALGYFLKAIENDPDMPAAHVNAGGLYLVKKEYEKAFKHLKKSLLLSPDDPVANLNMGGVLYHLQRPGEAKVYFEKVLALAPENEAARNNLALLKKMSRRRKK